MPPNDPPNPFDPDEVKRQTAEASAAVKEYTDTYAKLKIEAIAALEAMEQKMNPGGSLAKGIETLRKSLAAVGHAMGDTTKQTLRSVAGYTQYVVGAQVVTALNKGMAGQFGQVALSQYESVIAFNEATSAGGAYNDQISSLAFDLRQYGVVGDEAAKASAALYDGFTDLSVDGRNSDTEKSLIGVSAVLDKFGVPVGVSTKAMQSLRKGFGESDAQITNTMFGLKAFGKEIGISAAKVIGDFQAQAPMFAVYGDEGVRTFKRLAAAAKVTGLEMGTMIDFTKGFDTFKDATTAVGGLNAMLGGPYLNAVELVQETDPTERMKMLKQAFDDAGTSVSDMSYYQQKAFIDMIPGVENAQQLTQMLEGDFDALSGAIGATAESDAELQDSLKEQRSLDENRKVIEATGLAVKGIGDTLIGINTTGFIGTINSAEALRKKLDNEVKPIAESIMGILEGARKATGTTSADIEAAKQAAIKEMDVRNQDPKRYTIVLQVDGRTVAEAIAPHMQRP